MTDMLKDVGARLKALREICDLSINYLAEQTNITPEEYIAYENGEKDFTFTFLYKLSKIFNVDITILMTGEAPKLSSYSLVRANKGFPIKRRQGFQYQHMSYLLKNKKAEPFIVTAPYDASINTENCPLNSHEGQELDYIIEGELTVIIKNHIEVLQPGDVIQYDSATEHGMFASSERGCKFLAVVLDK